MHRATCNRNRVNRIMSRNTSSIHSCQALMTKTYRPFSNQDTPKAFVATTIFKIPGGNRSNNISRRDYRSFEQKVDVYIPGTVAITICKLSLQCPTSTFWILQQTKKKPTPNNNKKKQPKRFPVMQKLKHISSITREMLSTFA